MTVRVEDTGESEGMHVPADTPEAGGAGHGTAEFDGTREFLVFVQDEAPQYAGPPSEYADQFNTAAARKPQPYGTAFAVAVPDSADAPRVAAMTVMQHVGRLAKLAVVDAVIFDPTRGLIPEAGGRPLLNP